MNISEPALQRIPGNKLLWVEVMKTDKENGFLEENLSIFKSL